MRNTRLKELLAESPVVVTGMGALSAAGIGVAALWDGVIKGRGLAVPLGLKKPESLSFVAGCRVADPVMRPGCGALLSKADRSAQLAVCAAAEAWTHAGLDKGPVAPERIGVIAGTSRGPVSKLADALRRSESGRFLPSLAASSTISALSGTLSVHFGIRGFSTTVSTACASAATAIAMGAEQLLLGHVDAVLVGGAEAPLQPVVLGQLAAAGILGKGEDAATICRPFDLERNGTVLGEGAAFLVLEREEDARRRGTDIQARLAGWSSGAEGEQRTGMNPEADTLVAVIRQALQVADLSPEKVDYVNAHGTATRLNDRMEAQALLKVFGDAAAHIPCSSIKAVIGHCLGASGALEAVVAIEALHHQMVPPTANWTKPDAECPLDVIPGEARKLKLRNVMSNSCGFWGNNAVLIFNS